MVPTGLISPSKRYSGIMHEMIYKNKPKAKSFLQNFVEKILNLKILWIYINHVSIMEPLNDTRNRIKIFR